MQGKYKNSMTFGALPQTIGDASRRLTPARTQNASYHYLYHISVDCGNDNSHHLHRQPLTPPLKQPSFLPFITLETLLNVIFNRTWYQHRYWFVKLRSKFPKSNFELSNLHCVLYLSQNTTVVVFWLTYHFTLQLWYTTGMSQLKIAFWEFRSQFYKPISQKARHFLFILHVLYCPFRSVDDPRAETCRFIKHSET